MQKTYKKYQDQIQKSLEKAEKIEQEMDRYIAMGMTAESAFNLEKNSNDDLQKILGAIVVFFKDNNLQIAQKNDEYTIIKKPATPSAAQD